MWTDPAGDVRWIDAAAAPAASGPVDLRFLEVDEQPEAWWFWVGVEGLDSEMESLQTSGSDIRIPLEAAGRSYELFLGKGGASVTYYHASLGRVAPDGSVEWVWYTDTFAEELVQLDLGRKAVGVAVPRDILVGADGRALQRGAAVTVGQVRSATPVAGCVDPSCTVGPLLGATDAMPDAEASAGLTAIWGDVDAGLQVRGVDAFRASNGEAATFAFQVAVRNPGDEATIGLSATAPQGWDVAFPADAFRLAAGANRTLPVLVTTPFAHQHGGIETVLVRAERADDPRAFGETVLGIRYLSVPQPAGHHPTLYLHSRQVSTGLSHTSEAVMPSATRTPLTMNALEEDPRDAGLTVDARPDTTDPSRARYQWFAELSPALGIGLDADLGRTGQVHLPLLVRQPLAAVTVDVRLVLRGGAGGEPGSPYEPYFGEPILTLAAGRLDIGDLAPGAVGLDVELAAAPAADHLPYTPGSQLFLEVNLESAQPGIPLTASVPALEPGGWAALPLSEYSESERADVTALAGLGLSTPEPRRMANPGDTLVWDVTADPGTALSLVGLHAAEARLVERPGVAHVVFTAPTDGFDGEVFELFVVGRRAEAEAILKLAVEIDVDAEHADQAAEATRIQGKAGTPGFTAAAGLVGLAFAALARRRP